MNQPEKVLIIQRRLTRYRVPLFSRMQRALVRVGIELTVASGRPSKSEALRNDEGEFADLVVLKNKYLAMGGRTLVWQGGVREQVARHALVIMPHENSMLSNHLLLARKKQLGIKTAFLAHGGNLQSIEKNKIAEEIRQWSARKADWWFAYTDLSVQNLLGWGIDRNRITCVNNSIDTEPISEAVRDLTILDLNNLKSEIAMTGKRCAVFIGGLLPEKRLNFLFDAADRLRKAEADFELIIIGDGPLRELVSAFSATRSWVHWLGARFGKDMYRHALLGQVALNPGMVGLGILDCFALGLPLITTDCKIHSPEIAYLESESNGIMTPDNLDDYVSAVLNLLNDESLRNALAAGCRESAAKYTMDAMVQRFCEGIQAALNAPPLSNLRKSVH